MNQANKIDVREEILKILRWPYDKRPPRLTQSEAFRQLRADKILALITDQIRLELKEANLHKDTK